MRNYELIIVLDGKTTAAKKKSFGEKFEKVIKELKGKVGKTADLGTKELAYRIKKSTSGAFLMFPLELPGLAIKELNNKMKLESEVIRFLVIKK